MSWNELKVKLIELKTEVNANYIDKVIGIIGIHNEMIFFVEANDYNLNFFCIKLQLLIIIIASDKIHTQVYPKHKYSFMDYIFCSTYI